MEDFMAVESLGFTVFKPISNTVQYPRIPYAKSQFQISNGCDILSISKNSLDPGLRSCYALCIVYIKIHSIPGSKAT
jgi:hypothetical protein